MKVTLVFHQEPVESGQHVWWVDSPDVPGFYATRERLEEARLVSEAGVREILREERGNGESVTFAHVMADDRGSVPDSDAEVS